MTMKIMKKMKIDTIWEELEKDESFQTGLLYKRYSAKVKPDILVALKAPEKLRCISFLICSSFNLDTSKLNKFKDIKLEVSNDEKNSNKQALLILLLNTRHKDIFSTLCEDLISVVYEINDDNILIDKLLERLAKWQSLFEKLGHHGLSEEAQRGLFGELYFLRKYLSNSPDYVKCINTWMGPENAIQDFQYSNWAIEVKTTHGKNHQKIFISSERQLDDSIIPNIFLYHLSLDVRMGFGETLNFIIENVFNLLAENSFATNLFKLKLMEYGYFDIHKNCYNDNGYTIRQENIYYVIGDFPRITEKQIPAGVGDVKYSIILTESESWKINEVNLFNKISEN
ncbi:Uncharacterised protein [uncultured archaeon]|nr:Uncharacterised protein [uncultured archaeon]